MMGLISAILKILLASGALSISTDKGVSINTKFKARLIMAALYAWAVYDLAMLAFGGN